MTAQDLNEAAHVGALELIGQADRHSDHRDGRLLLMVAIEDDDGMADVAHTSLVERQLAIILTVLYVLELHVVSPRYRHPEVHVSRTVSSERVGRRPIKRAQIHRARFSLVGLLKPSMSFK